MKTTQFPVAFFQSLTELESHLHAAERLGILLAQSVDNHCSAHPEKDSLQVHLHYLRESVKRLEEGRLRFNLMRRYFTPEIQQPLSEEKHHEKES